MFIKRPFIILLFIVSLLALAGYFYVKMVLVPEAVEVIEEYDISGINNPLNENMFTVDIVIFHSENTEVTWDQLKEEFKTADSIYRSYGVQLNLKKALKVTYPSNWKGMAINKVTNIPQDDMDLDFYDLINYSQECLSEEIESIFNAFLSILPNEENPERTIYIIPLSDLTISWFEKDKNNKWIEVHSKTSAISFPPYIYADRIPKHLRGIISFQRSGKDRKTMAHELGHKLINVSHEGLDKGPQGGGDSIPGLMGYGNSFEIFGGKKGRWHQERLLRSPFLYKINDGRKVWNEEYKNGGCYDDPIYQGLIMK